MTLFLERIYQPVYRRDRPRRRPGVVLDPRHGGAVPRRAADQQIRSAFQVDYHERGFCRRRFDLVDNGFPGDV
jgi:hypothetical protein